MNFSCISISQHAIDRFICKYLEKDSTHRLFADEYYQNAIIKLLKDSVEIEIPLQDQILKAIKYANDKPSRYFLNRREKVLFVIVGDETLVTIYYPYDDSRRHELRKTRGLYKRKRKKRK